MSEIWGTQTLQEAHVAFALASGLIYEEPNTEHVSSLIEGNVFADAPFGIDDQYVKEGLGRLQRWCAEAKAVPVDECVSALRREWFMLFVGGGTPPAPCWQSFYLESNNQLFGHYTLEVRALYREFGLKTEGESREPDDHLGLMLRFMGYLIGLEAAEQSDPREILRMREVQEELLCRHILPWILIWHYQVHAHANSEFYRGVSDLTLGFCRAYARRFGIVHDLDAKAFTYVAGGKVLERSR